MGGANVWIASSYQSDFARNYAREGRDISDMVAEAVAGTLESAGLWSKPASRHEAACASGSVAVLAAMAGIEAGHYDCVLVIAVEQERNVPGDLAPQHLGAAAWVGHEGQDATYVWPYMFSELADEYDRRYGLDDRHRGQLRPHTGGLNMVDVEVYGKMLSTLPADDDHPYRSGPWRPQSVEYDATDLDVVGELPEDIMQTRLHRWRMNLVTGQTREEDLSETCTEFGTINSGFGGRPYRYNYAATNEPGWFLFNGLVKHDTLTGREEQYQFSPGVFCSEVGVAPRVGGTDEDDAYLVTRERSCPSGSLAARTAAGRRASPSEGGSRPA